MGIREIKPSFFSDLNYRYIGKLGTADIQLVCGGHTVDIQLICGGHTVDMRLIYAEYNLMYGQKLIA